MNTVEALPEDHATPQRPIEGTEFHLSEVEVIDLRDLELDALVARLDDVARQGNYVMHGAANREDDLIEEFDPQRSTLGGKKQSVYASDDPRAAIFNAIYQKHGEAAKKLRELDYGEGASSTMHMKRGEGHASFVIPQIQAEVIEEAIAEGPTSEMWHELFADGYVYFLPKEAFTQEPPDFDQSVAEDYTDHEWNTQQPVRPVLAVRVSSSLIRDLLVFRGDGQNTEVLTTQRLRARAIAYAQSEFDQLLAPGDTLNAQDIAALNTMLNADDPNTPQKRVLLERASAAIGDLSLPRAEVTRLLAELYYQ